MSLRDVKVVGARYWMEVERENYSRLKSAVQIHIPLHAEFDYQLGSIIYAEVELKLVILSEFHPRST